MKLRILCIITCLCVLLSTNTFASTLSDNTRVSSTEVDEVEAIAINYITQYVYNSYLYYTNDLYEGTIHEVLEEQYCTQEQNDCYSVAGESVSTSVLSDRIDSFKAASDYFRYIRTTQEITRYDFTYSPTVIETSITNDSAYVHIYTEISFKYELDGETALCGDNYIVYLQKIQGQWIIVDVQSEELISYGFTDLNTTYSDRISTFNQMLAGNVDSSTNTSFASLTAESTSTSDYDRAYNVNNAIAYAYTYTTSAYNESSIGNNSSFLNDNFSDYTNYGGNCQNFVSQCVWAGFGGNDTLEAVNNHDFPMNDNWYETKSTMAHTASWTSTSFFDYISSSDCEMTTVYGFANGNFSGIPLSYLRGAVLHVNPKEDGYSHAVIITKAIGQSFSDIEICANSPMRKAVRLCDQPYDDSMRLIMPTAMKSGRTCTGGTHLFTGNHCKCNYCGYNKLTVTGTMLKPIAAGTTKTISASANSSCYRMAICIRYGNTEQWTEYLNTSQINKTFTFSNAGLYTITVSARDVAPSDANSVTATHVFKIRVY